MSIAADCPSCMTGNHGGHVRDWNIIQGIIGGSYCPCTGDCAERAAAAFEASPFAQAFAQVQNHPEGRRVTGHGLSEAET